MRLTIKPIAPFDFDLSAGIFSEGDGQIQRYEKGRYWQVIRVCGSLVLVCLTSSGTVEVPGLSADLFFEGDLSEADLGVAVKISRSLLNVDLDLAPFYGEVANDEVMSRMVVALRGLHSPTTSTAFEALIASITEQQISIKVARTVQKRLVRAFGDTVCHSDRVYYSFPTPERLAEANAGEIRGCGLSQRKAEYIREVSGLVAGGGLDLEAMRNLEEGVIIGELSRVRGIGAWTAEQTMVRGMGRLDVIPADDLGLRRCISLYYCGGRKITGKEAREIARAWGSWPGLASFYLMVAEAMGIPPRPVAPGVRDG